MVNIQVNTFVAEQIYFCDHNDAGGNTAAISSILNMHDYLQLNTQRYCSIQQTPETSRSSISVVMYMMQQRVDTHSDQATLHAN